LCERCGGGAVDANHVSQYTNSAMQKSMPEHEALLIRNLRSTPKSVYPLSS